MPGSDPDDFDANSPGRGLSAGQSVFALLFA